MKNTVKRLLACLMVAAMILSVSVTAFALEGMQQTDRALEAKSVASYDLSAIRNGKTFAVAEQNAMDEIAPDQIVPIMVEMKDAPAMEVYSQYKSTKSYTASLRAKQDAAVKDIEKKFDLDLDEVYNYTLLFNGFSFYGEYRLVEEINKIEGLRAFVAMEWGAPDIQLYNSTNMVNAIAAWDLGYTGEGMIVADIDTGLMVTHPAFSVMPDEDTVRFTQDDIAEIIAGGELYGSITGASNMNINRVYYNAKVPFRWNYVKNTHNVNHVYNDHGTHVGGIIAGNNDVITGVAPDAQLAGMQVFGDTGGASWNHILLALEDCVVLGVDAANLSLGSANGFTHYYDPSYAVVFENLINAGVNLAMAAGNDYSATYNNAWGGYAYVANPDYGVVGSPSTWPESLSVAANNNTMTQGYYIEFEGQKMGYSENESNVVKLVDTFGGETLPFVVVPGLGEVADYEGIDGEGKVAFVKRGEITFVEKAQNAQAHGAIACVVYNNVQEAINMATDESITIPFIIISKNDGDIIAAAGEGEIFVSEDSELMEAIGGGQPVGFSSWGTTSDLWIKPEITAPGGNIYSATSPNFSSGYYESWSGTSMATPHVAGGMAIVSAYVNDVFPDLTTAEKQIMVDTLLMSTAKPVNDNGGFYASVRHQGAGMMDLKDATTTTAYITVENNVRPKLELGDDPERTGVYELKFTVNNFGETDLEFDIDTFVGMDDIVLLDFDPDGNYVIGYAQTEWEVTEDCDIQAEELIIVPAGDKVDVTIVITLSDALRDDIEVYYMNYGFIEGFVRLKSANGLLGDADGDGELEAADALAVMRYAMGIGELDNLAICDINHDGVINLQDALLILRHTMGLNSGAEFAEVENAELGLPYLAFYGDWNKDVPMLDEGYYYDDYSVGSHPYDNFVGSVQGPYAYGLGINPYVDTDDMTYYNPDRNAVSPNGDGFLDTADTLYVGLMRNSAYMAYELLDSEGNKLATLRDDQDVWKGFYYSSGDYYMQCGIHQMIMPAWNAEPYADQDLTIHVYAKLANDGKITTEPFGDPADNANGVWDIPVYVDVEAPVAVMNADGTFSISDNHYAAYIGAWKGSMVNGELVLEQCIDEAGIFEEERGKTTTVQLTTTTEGDAPVQANLICIGDYAGNEVVYEITAEGLVPMEGVEGWSHTGVAVPDVDLYAYGSNLNSQTWVRFSSTNLEDLYYAGGVTSDTADYLCGTYDGTYVYGINDSFKLYRYDASDITAWGSRKLMGTISGVDYGFYEMAYDPSTDTLYGVAGLGIVYEIDPETCTATYVCEPAYGVMAMAFDEEGTCYVIDVYGDFATMDIATGDELEQLGNYGIAPLSSSGSFLPQCGYYIDGYFFWVSCPGDATSYSQVHVLAIKCNTGDFADLGAVMGGLYPVGLFAWQYPIPEASVDPVDFYENFEGAFNWTVLDADGDGNNWGVDYWSSGLYFDGSKAAVSYSWNEIVLYPDNWMFSPEFHIGEGEKFLSFWVASANQGAGADIDEHYQVLIAPAGTPDGTEGWTVLYETIMDTASLTEHCLNVSDYAGQDVRLAFRHFDCFDEYTLIIDGIGVGDWVSEEPAPTAQPVGEVVMMPLGTEPLTMNTVKIAKVPFNGELA